MRRRFTQTELDKMVGNHFNAQMEWQNLGGPKPTLDLRNTDLIGMRFNKPLLQNIDFTNSYLDGVVFPDGCRLDESDFTNTSIVDIEFTDGNMSRCKFIGAHMVRVKITGTYFSDSNFEHAVIKECNFKSSTFYGAKFYGCDIDDTIFAKANIVRGDFETATISNTSFKSASANSAIFTSGSLYNVDFTDSYLQRAFFNNVSMQNSCKFKGALLDNTNFHESKIDIEDLNEVRIPHTTIGLNMACPEEGAFIGWKYVRNNRDYYLIKLLIPEDAKRSSATTRKCRCDKAFVLDIVDLFNESIHYEKCENPNAKIYTREKIVYKVGETVYPDSWDEDRWVECSHGIHFFITKQEAINYGSL